MVDDMTRLTELVLIVLRLQVCDVLLECEDPVSPWIRRRRPTSFCNRLGWEGGLQIKDVCYRQTKVRSISDRVVSVRTTRLTLDGLFGRLVPQSGEGLRRTGATGQREDRKRYAGRRILW